MTYVVGANPAGVAVGDVNGDAILDIVSVNSGDGTISVLIGNGDGTFETHVDYSGATNPLLGSVAVSDLNHDGRADIVVTSNDTSSVLVFLSLEGGAMSPPQPYATAFNPNMIVVRDFNGDGNPDLAVLNSGGGSISVLLGNGDGTFQEANNVGVGDNALYECVGDVNGDGKLDIVALYEGEAITNGVADVILGDGGDSFVEGNTFGCVPSTDRLQPRRGRSGMTLSGMVTSRL